MFYLSSNVCSTSRAKLVLNTKCRSETKCRNEGRQKMSALPCASKEHSPVARRTSGTWDDKPIIVIDKEMQLGPSSEPFDYQRMYWQIMKIIEDKKAVRTASRPKAPTDATTMEKTTVVESSKYLFSLPQLWMTNKSDFSNFQVKKSWRSRKVCIIWKTFPLDLTFSWVNIVRNQKVIHWNG